MGSMISYFDQTVFDVSFFRLMMQITAEEHPERAALFLEMCDWFDDKKSRFSNISFFMYITKQHPDPFVAAVYEKCTDEEITEWERLDQELYSLNSADREPLSLETQEKLSCLLKEYITINLGYCPDLILYPEDFV
jgi:hypothetical protein